MDKEKKTEIIGNFRAREGDTGSTEVQVALLTERINQLTTHMAANRHDFTHNGACLSSLGRGESSWLISAERM